MHLWSKKSSTAENKASTEKIALDVLPQTTSDSKAMDSMNTEQQRKTLNLKIYGNPAIERRLHKRYSINKLFLMHNQERPKPKPAKE
jgi:CTP synthase (UTP-ammonia lyase)